MNVLITGSNGQIGWELARCAPPDWTVHALDRTRLDLAQPESIPPALRALRPELIINAAAYTAVDRAEDEPDLAQRINAEAVGVVAREARALGAAMVHFSTDYIFDGAKSTPYTPNDRPNPQSAYARSKLAGEQALVDSGASHLIIRTEWVYSLRGNNFLLAILRQAVSKPELRIVNDQIGSPTWARSIAQTSLEMIRKSTGGVAGARHFSGHEGLYHATCSGQTTWFDFARAIIEEARLANAPRLQPITTGQYAARAKRPAYSVLDCSSTQRAFGITMPSWREALQQALSDRAALADALARGQQESARHEHPQSAAKTRG